MCDWNACKIVGQTALYVPVILNSILWKWYFMSYIAYFRGDYGNALLHYEKGITKLPEVRLIWIKHHYLFSFKTHLLNLYSGAC
jgi:hypothetical protein